MKSTAGLQAEWGQSSSTHAQTPFGNAPTLPLYKYPKTATSESYPTSNSFAKSFSSNFASFSFLAPANTALKNTLLAARMHRCTGTSRPPATTILASVKKSNSGDSNTDSRFSERRLRAEMSGGETSEERDSVVAATQQMLLLPLKSLESERAAL